MYHPTFHCLTVLNGQNISPSSLVSLGELEKERKKEGSFKLHSNKAKNSRKNYNREVTLQPRLPSCSRWPEYVSPHSLIGISDLEKEVAFELLSNTVDFQVNDKKCVPNQLLAQPSLPNCFKCPEWIDATSLISPASDGQHCISKTVKEDEQTHTRTLQPPPPSIRTLHSFRSVRCDPLANTNKISAVYVLH